MTLEWTLGIIGGFLTLNITINKLLSNRKESKIIKTIKDDVTQRFIPYDEKLKEHDVKFSKIEKDIVDIKIFTGKTETNIEHIKCSIDEVKDLVNDLLLLTNRTREHIPYKDIDKKK